MKPKYPFMSWVQTVYLVGVIDAVAGVEVQEIAVGEDGGMGGNMRIGACLVGDVKEPENVRMQ